MRAKKFWKKYYSTFFIVAGVVILLGSVLLELKFGDKQFARFIGLCLSSIASIFLVSGIWEVISKKQFVGELLEKMQIKETIHKSGIVDCYDNNLINWTNLLQNANSLKMYICFGRKWTKPNLQHLVTELLKKRNSKVIVVLPDFREQDVLEALLAKYPKDFGSDNTLDTIKQAIENVATGFVNLDKKIEVRLFKGINSSSYYFIDDKCLFSPYLHINGDTSIKVPCIELQKNSNKESLFQMCEKDFNNIVNSSTIFAG